MKEDEKNNEPTEKEAYKNENIEIKKKEEDKIEEKILSELDLLLRLLSL